MESRLKITIPSNEIENGVWHQIKKALEFPFLKKLAIMPDVHQGYDLPIGGVALLDNMIWPGAVGYDIGCGMCHITTDIRQDDIEGKERDIYNILLEDVPVGFSAHQSPISLNEEFTNADGNKNLYDKVMSKAGLQLGTLGGGNHFIEIGVNKDNKIGITIHSGSRNPGHSIGSHYMKKTNGPVSIDSDIGKSYYKDMKWAEEYALMNRKMMMGACLDALNLSYNLFDNMINENHNHAELTEEGVLHRKGATQANIGQLGIIPANMRDGVWITKGLGNEEYLCSASHGAGRKMSRKRAKENVDIEQFRDDMRNIVSPREESCLDENPEAYKNIDEVIKAQDGILVDVIDHFKPLIVIKG